jgi:phosphoenolpyruvate synthase/pyruvate phosphate dikinase
MPINDLDKLKPENYKRLFMIEKGVGFLISDLFMNQYRHLDGLLIYSKGTWTAYISNKSHKKSLRDGLKLFSLNIHYKKYRKKFLDYLYRVDKFKMNIDLKNITEQGVKNISDIFKEIWKHYHKTEFFYTDLAYEKSNSNKTLQKNLKDLQKFKMAGRNAMNDLGFNHFYVYIDAVADKLGREKNELRFLNQKEIINLFHNPEIQYLKAKKRQQRFVIYSVRGKVIELDDKNAYQIIKRFEKNITETSELKGTVAHPGFVKGKARVILLNYNNIKEQLKQIAQMHEGEILVAETTSPEFTPALKKAKAVITNQGGLGSHAAIVSRELGIPCIVGTQTATAVIKTGDDLEVDANKGIVKIIEQ